MFYCYVPRILLKWLFTLMCKYAFSMVKTICMGIKYVDAWFTTLKCLFFYHMSEDIIQFLAYHITSVHFPHTKNNQFYSMSCHGHICSFTTHLILTAYLYNMICFDCGALHNPCILCWQCSYTAMKLADKCKTERHTIVKSETSKRFFKCKHCGKRKISIHKYPTEPW